MTPTFCIRHSDVHGPRNVFGRLSMAIAVVAVLQLAAATASAQFVISQAKGTNYIAWEAQDGTIMNGDDATGWLYVDNDPENDAKDGPPTPTQANSGSIVLPSNTNATRGDALYDQLGGNDQDWVNYQLQFAEPGTYHLYMHYTMFERDGDDAYGGEDSVYFPREFGVPPLGPRGDNNFWASLPNQGASFTNGQQIDGEAVEGQMEGYFHWWRVTAQDPAVDGEGSDIKVITQANVGTVLDFGMAAREQAGVVDKLVMSTDPDLTPEDLDRLPSFVPLPEGAVLGDFNADGNIDLVDFNIIASNFNKKFSITNFENFTNGDVNGDLLVNMEDFLQFRDIFASQGAIGAAVPEPATLTLMGFGLAVAAHLVRRRRKT